jgi:hypothetical protein
MMRKMSLKNENDAVEKIKREGELNGRKRRRF